MTTYTKAILELIEKNPGISGSEIDSRLGLQGRNAESLIWPYIKRGLIRIEKVRVAGERKLRVTFSAVGKLRDSAESARRSCYKKWTAEDLDVLVSLYPEHSNSSIAKRLGRTLKQIESKSEKLKLFKSEERMNKLANPTHWSTQDVRIVVNLYSEKTTRELAELLQRSEAQVLRQARKLGLKKSDAFRKRCGKHLVLSGAETQTRSQPIGTEKIWNRYICVKVRDPGIWELKQKLVWRAHRGEYNTKTHTLWFIDRNPLNCDISNLELITKTEMMSRTSIMKYPKELRDVITLHNELKRKLSEQYRDIA